MRKQTKVMIGMSVVTAMIWGVAFVSQIAGAAPNPPGNNGTVKIDGTPFDDHPNNEPHVGCTFQVDFYNYDEGDLFADVTFETQAPTTPQNSVLLTDHVFIGEDPNGGGTDLDASETYTLDFTGFTPHAIQGFHVKLTVNAEGSIGADVKHKVFWVTGCGPTTTTTTTTTTPTETTTTTPTETTTTTSPVTTTTTQTTPTTTTSTSSTTTTTTSSTTTTSPATTTTTRATTTTSPVVTTTTSAVIPPPATTTVTSTTSAPPPVQAPPPGNQPPGNQPPNQGPGPNQPPAQGPPTTAFTGPGDDILPLSVIAATLLLFGAGLLWISRKPKGAKH